MSVPSAAPGPTVSFGRRVEMAETRSSPTSPTATATESAMHRSPAAPYAAETMASAAMSMSASGSTSAWFFAPPSAWTRLPFAVPRS